MSSGEFDYEEVIDTLDNLSLANDVEMSEVLEEEDWNLMQCDQNDMVETRAQVTNRLACPKLDWPIKKRTSWNGKFFLTHRKYRFDRFFGPVFTMDGLGDDGSTIRLTAHGFQPRFYMRFNNSRCLSPLDATEILDFTTDVIEDFIRSDEGGEALGYRRKELIELDTLISSTRIVKKRNQNEFYVDDEDEFLEVCTTHPQLVGLFAAFLANPHGRARGDEFWSYEIPAWCPLSLVDMAHKVLLYDSNVDFDLVFESNTRIANCFWYHFDPDQFVNSTYRLTEFDYEMKPVHYTKFQEAITHNTTAEMPPFKEMHFDIEVSAGQKFPDHREHPVIQICAFFTQGDWIQRVAWILGTADSPRGGPPILKFEFDKETDLLAHFAEFFKLADPDIVLAHNGNGFDWPYLINRAKHLKVKDFEASLSRLVWNKPQLRTDKVKGQTRHACDIPGRWVVDTLRWRRLLYNAYDCRLAACAKEFLDRETKIDLDYDKISNKQLTHDGRTELLEYCMKDAELVMLLANVWNVKNGIITHAQIFGIPPHKFLNREMSTKVDCIVTDTYGKHNAVHLDRKFKCRHKRQRLEVIGSDRGKAIRGAITIPQKVGYYMKEVPAEMKVRCPHLKEGCVVCLDFRSLYPNVVRHYNIGPDTIGHRDEFEAAGFEEGRDFVQMKDYGEAASYDAPCFLKAHIKVSLVARRLGEMWDLRNQEKAKMATLERARDRLPEGDIEGRRRLAALISVADSRQQAVKLGMNSTFGCWGFKDSRLVFFALADSITRGGRHSLEKSRDLILKKFGYEAVYGDTDSLFLWLNPGDDGPNTMIEISKYVNAQLGQYLDFAPEKTFNYLILSGIKKNYQDRRVEFPKPEHMAKNVTAGARFAKNQACKFVRDTCFEIRDKLFQADPRDQLQVITELMQAAVKRLADGKVRLDEEIEQQRLGDDITNYTSVTTGVHVATRAWMQECYEAEDMGLKPPPPPSAGTIVHWIVCKEADTEDKKKAKNKGPRSWPPEIVAERDLTPDIVHYHDALEKQLINNYAVALMALSGENPADPVIEAMPEYNEATRKKKIAERKKYHKVPIQRVLATSSSKTMTRPPKLGKGSIGHYFQRKRKRTDDQETLDIEDMLEHSMAECKRCVGGNPPESLDMDDPEVASWHTQSLARAMDCDAWTCKERGVRHYCERKLLALKSSID
jgi:DNA polymerase elongation subunit (family B)